VYGVAGATVSLQVKGLESHPNFAWEADNQEPNYVPRSAIELSPTMLSVTASGSTATLSVDPQGSVAFPAGAMGIWSLGNAGGIAQNIRDVYLGTYTGSGMQFYRWQGDTSNPVNCLVPGAIENFFDWQSGVANGVVPKPSANLAAPGGALSLNSDDFNWALTPADRLSRNTSDGRYSVLDSQPAEVTFVGMLKYDPSKTISGKLKVGLTSFAILPAEIFLSQNIINASAALYQRNLYVTVKAANGAIVTSQPSSQCYGCPLAIRPEQIMWESSDSGLATVDDKGLLSSVPNALLGSLQVTARLAADANRIATASVTVSNYGGLPLGVE
ncbi:MAG: hypothetical protein HY692_06850, partial [Cyanobacteria bacterium NC_groundwater_1444_Ag_S-0.65um_54_12]|nr:hypothetical protein [Cyanobacteria bacterium NC_groundwater_1444_Ag_S-0.65um_54_12]